MGIRLTSDLGRTATEHVLPMITAMMAGKVLKRDHLHIVVGNPGYEYRPGITCGVWAENGGILYERAIGERAQWQSPYDQIARSKAYMSWRTGLSTREIQFQHPELLIPGDTCYYGSAVEPVSRWVIGVSGVEPYFDEAFAKCILAMCQALQFREHAQPAVGHFYKP
jgi:hypothetical protein